MSFELKPQESLRKGIARIVRKELKTALEELSRAHRISRDGAVHEARKCFKKVRAVLRLVRPALGTKVYGAENVCFRDAARPLTEVRDAKILVETLDNLAEHFHEHIVGRSFEAVRKTLQEHLRAERKRVLDEQNAFAVVAQVVREALDRVKSWAGVPNRWSSVGKGLEDTYRRAHAAFAAATDDTTVETLHEWRKQSKYLRHQLELLRPLWPERLEELAHEADEMSDLLGDDHDLAVLRQRLTADDNRFADDANREVLMALIDRRRAELEREAHLLGTRFFQDTPRQFTRRLKGYWHAQPGGEAPVGAAKQVIHPS